jgi:hypothetical protein
LSSPGRAAVAIISVLMLVPLSLGLLLSGNDADNTALVGRLIALGIVCGTIATINSIANHHSKGDTQ